MAGTAINVPSTGYKANDPGIDSSKKEQFIIDLGGATQASLIAVSSVASSAQISANAAQNTADSAQTTANSAETTANSAETTANAAETTADAAKVTADNSVQLSGDQAVEGVKTFGSFMVYDTIQASPLDDEVPRMLDVNSAVAAGINIPTANVSFVATGFTVNSSSWKVRTVNGGLKFHNVNINATNAAEVTNGVLSTTIPYTSTEVFVGYGTYASSIFGGLRVYVSSVSDELVVSLLKAESGQGWEIETWDFNFSFFTFDEA